MSKVKIAISGSNDLMIHWPSGKVEFMGWIASLRLAWYLLRNGRDFEVIGHRKTERATQKEPS